MRESPIELGCFAETYLRSMPGARLFQSKGERASRSEERPRDRIARSRPALSRREESIARESVTNWKFTTSGFSRISYSGHDLIDSLSQRAMLGLVPEGS